MNQNGQKIFDNSFSSIYELIMSR